MARPRQPLVDPLDAFCKDTKAYLAGPLGGPLSNLNFAAKDIFDVAGHVTEATPIGRRLTHRPSATPGSCRPW